MAELRNEFSWSISRAKIFAECRRKYYFYYYGSWNGWRDDGPESARLYYRLKQILPLPFWTGRIVHRVIENAVKRLWQGRRPSLDRMQKFARDIMNSEWKESQEGLWARYPKKYANLFEHYYNIEIDAEQRAALREKVFDALAGFFETGCCEELADLKPSEWLSAEELASFEVGGIKVWAALDCAFRRDGEVFVYDWKTGSAPEDDRYQDQLLCYAMFASRNWNIPVESVRPACVYLNERNMERLTPSAESIIEFRERLMASAGEMTGGLADPQNNIARETDFPRVDHPRTCTRCEFYEACFGDRSLQLSLMDSNGLP